MEVQKTQQRFQANEVVQIVMVNEWEKPEMNFQF